MAELFRELGDTLPLPFWFYLDIVMPTMRSMMVVVGKVRRDGESLSIQTKLE